MTSEICISNRRALVLAADSAVTVTRWENGNREVRYFKGANKIFQLSDFHPVGVMIFDSAELHKVPWEIILKDFRTTLGKKHCGGLSSYAEEFFKFIEESQSIFTQDLRKRIFIETIDQAMIRMINHINEEPGVKEATDEAAANAAREKAFQDAILYAKDWHSLVAVSEDELRSAIDLEMDVLRTEAEYNIKNFGRGADFDVDALIYLGGKYVLSFPEMALPCTGIVIAGFGDNDYFPSYISYECNGLLAETLLRSEKDSHTVDRNTSGHINAFATKAMVDTFTMGFGPDVLESVTSSLHGVLKVFADKVCQKTGSALPEIEDLVRETVIDHRNQWAQDVISKHTHPFQRVIGSLPIDEMVGLAETLVMLESLKEKVTQPSESVGGPIDVAIITKNEGFLWAKRKHFFDSNLNPRFAHRQQELYRSVREGDAV